MQNTDTILEALLFVKTEPISIKKLSELLKVDANEVAEAILALKEKLSGRGIRLIEKGDEIMLGTALEASGFIESVLKEEMSRDLGRAGLETISIILYKSPVTKNEIDFIRGVNSQFILRNLLVRGLVERIQNPNGRAALYQPTFDLLRFLGMEKIDDLPDYRKISESLKKSEVNVQAMEEVSPDEPTFNTDEKRDVSRSEDRAE